MVKNDTKIKEIKNFEEYRNKLMKEIIQESVDWTIDEEGSNYQNCKTGEIIHFSNFSPEKNELIKSCLERKIKLVPLNQLVQLMGREGKTRGVVRTGIENKTDYENKIETPIKKS